MTTQPPLAFDDLVIDFAGRRLLKGGVEQPLEPKAFDVLALLAGAPGRAFTRDEILDAVWGHRHVTPAVLNRIMSLLRHALGEDAHHARYLHTLYGVGYRFNLPFEGAVVHPAPRPLGMTGEYAPPDAAGAIGAMASTPRDGEDTPGVRRRRAGDRVPPTRSRWRAVLWLAPMLAVLAFAGWRAWPRAEPMPAAAPPPPSATPTLVVMPLKAIGDGEAVRVLADGLSEELIGSLAQIGGLRVIARESTRLAAAESNDPARMVQRLGITHALEGSLQQNGQSLRARVRLVDARSGGALWTREFDRDAAEVLLLQRNIAEAVAASMTLKLGLAAAPARSGDAEFLRRYLVARALVFRRELTVDASAETAEAEFRALLRERPDDARAHAGLALALEERAKRRPLLAQSLREEALREAAIARRLDPTLLEPRLVEFEDACRKAAWERCLAGASGVRALAPGNADVDFAHSFAIARLGYLDRAEALLREAIARDPMNTGPHFMLGRILDTQGRHEEARVELDKTLLDGAYARWFNAVWRGNHAAALRIAEGQISAPDHPAAYTPWLASGYVAASRALADPVLWPHALAEFDKFERTTGLWNFSRVLAPDAPAHAAETIRRLDEVRRRGYSSWDLLLWTKDLAWLRRDPAFQDYLRDNGILAYWQAHGFPPQCRPRGAGVHCD